MTTPSSNISVVRVGAEPGGRWLLGVIGKRTWTVHRGRCELASEQLPLVEQPLIDLEAGVLLHDADVALHRTRADVIVEGHAYSPGTSSFEASLRVGPLTRTIRVTGPRRLERDYYGRPRFTPADRVERVWLGWQNAYGGVDLAARAAMGDPFEQFQLDAGDTPDPRYGLFAYPRNPAGRGYLIEPTPAAIAACELPLLEEPTWLLTPANVVREDFVRWPEGPPIAALGWLSHSYFPRSALLGCNPLVYDGQRLSPQAFFEVRMGELKPEGVRPDTPIADRLDLRVAQSAAIGMRSPLLSPGDEVELVNLHPNLARWSFRLPTEQPRMAVRLPGAAALELTPKIVTLMIEPDCERVSLVWVGQTLLDHALGPKESRRVEHVVMWR